MLAFYDTLEVPSLPDGVEPLLPFQKAQVRDGMTAFYQRYYNDNEPRVLLFGINPGRLGAGLTGIGFTDPVRLQEVCGIPNPHPKRAEPSSTFIYDVINAFGGPERFFAHFHFTSVCPIGFVHKGINMNYYDTPQLREATTPFIIDCIRKQVGINVKTNVAFTVGKGQNRRFLEKLNTEHGFFGKLGTLPHPRWVMQYRYKTRNIYVEEYVKTLGSVLSEF